MKDLELVYAVYHYGSFSKASEKLFISQSALSMAIQRLENELGLPLFDRRQHPVVLTEAGSLCLQYYLQMKPLEKDLIHQLNDIRNLKSGSISIGGTNFLLSCILPDTITAFSARYPGIRLNIIEAPSAAFNALLLDGKIDLCLKCDFSDSNIFPLLHAFYDVLFLAVPISSVKKLALSDNYLTGADIIMGDYVEKEHYFKVSDFEKITFLQLTPGNNLYLRSEEIFKNCGFKPKQTIIFEQFLTTFHLAASGLGCTLTSERIIKNNVDAKLVYYCLPSPLMTRDFHFTVRKNAYISKSVRAFCEIFLETEKAKL